MKLIVFKLIQTAALLLFWPLAFVALALGGAVFMFWHVLGALAHIWAFSPKDHHA